MNKWKTIAVIAWIIVFTILLSVIMLSTASSNQEKAPSAPSCTPTGSIIVETCPSSATNPSEPILVGDIAEEALKVKIEYISNLSKEEIIVERRKVMEQVIYLWKILGSLNWKADDYLEASEELMNEIERLNSLDKVYCEEYLAIVKAEEEALWEQRAQEYPVATEVWLFLKEELGYSDAVCAGIMGNLMAECGGQTLKLKWNAVNKKTGCYGLCQWHPKYYPELQNTGLSEQLEHMKTSFPKVLSRYLSICYKEDFTYEDFLALEDPAEVAYAFCVTYERPGPGSYNQRMKNAEKAYEYFTVKGE